jgi:hypothetical protein
MTDEEFVRRLADGEDPWVIDPEYGCTNPLTGYFPAREVAAELEARTPTRVAAVACPACGGPGCEQCEGAGWVWRVPNNLSPDEVHRQKHEILGINPP